MAQIRKLGVETETQSSADKFYSRFRNNMTELTKIYPEVYKGIEILKGDGKSTGSLILWKYAMGGETVIETTERIISMDDKNRSIGFQVIEGTPMDSFKTVVLKIHVTANNNKGGVVKWCMEYEKASECVPDPNIFLEFLDKVTKKYDAYLVKEQIKNK